ncbi:hypothetical protein HAX54_017556, partial [Datura stramonium]|nr:hypothetical protein [Datura stramonium]
MGKTIEEALHLLNEISENAIQWPSDCVVIKKAATVNTQQPSQFEAYHMCGGNHLNHECQATNQNDEQVQNPPGYSNQNRGQPKFLPYQQRPQQAHPGLDDLLY